jgi:serine/threonine-protein kinase RsbW
LPVAFFRKLFYLTRLCAFSIFTLKSNEIIFLMKKSQNKNKFEEDFLVLPSDSCQLKKVEEFAQNIARKASLSEDKSDNVAIVLTELVNNAILHGNKKHPEKKVKLKAKYYNDKLVLIVKDEGFGFDPTTIKNPTDPENIWRENGRGIFLVKHLIDKVEFRQTSSGMEIIVTVLINNNC